MDAITLTPIAHVRARRPSHQDDFWRGEVSEIVLSDAFPEAALYGLSAFSHLEVIFCFDQVDEEKVQRGARHPRNNLEWPEVGIFAQRARSRPNRLGLSRCRLVDVRGRTLDVLDLDALDGTPVLDIKPWMAETAPIGAVRQPAWSRALMADYYRPVEEAGSGGAAEEG